MSEPKHPPRRSAHLLVGRKYRVVQSFSASGTDFSAGETLEFDREMYDVYDSCDKWIFRVVDSGQLKEIAGYGKAADPAGWLGFFELA